MASEPRTSLDLFDPWERPRGEDDGNEERRREEQREKLEGHDEEILDNRRQDVKWENARLKGG